MHAMMQHNCIQAEGERIGNKRASQPCTCLLINFTKVKVKVGRVKVRVLRVRDRVGQR